MSDLESASEYALLVAVTDVAKDEVDGITMNIVTGDVAASDPSFPRHDVTLDVPADTGTAESVEMLPGHEYAVFVKVSDDGQAYLTSADQGVFPVVGGVAGSSAAGTFPLGDVGRQLGLAE